ncbi:MAG: hypothetical protein ACYTGQ_06395 [Planctomycetota bacterium]|jgi:hypothetical protein
MKYSLLAILVTTTLLAGVGCETQSQTVGLEKGLVKPEPLQPAQEEKAENRIAKIMPWNWKAFNKDDQTAETAQYQEPKGDSPLAFWKWFEKDPNAPLTEKEILNNLTPELAGRSQTHGELRILKAKRDNLNARGMHDDIFKFFMWDKPSHLSMYPTP